MSAPASPLLAAGREYPFARLNAAKRAAAARGVDLIDLGVGEPREETPAFIRAALADAIEPLSRYPLAEGLPELREAIAGWAERRFGTALDPAREVIPTLGSKEAIFSLALALADAPGGRDLVAVTTPGYPVPPLGARFAGCDVIEMPLPAGSGHVPDVASLGRDVLARLAVMWINYPNNPTGATIARERLEELAALAREHGFVLASDEAYSEIWLDGGPPSGALELADRRNVLAFNSLSKRSAMAGYRSGFVAGDPELIALLKRFRPGVGATPQEFVQRAAAVAWSDEEHVEGMRARYRERRGVLLPAFEAAGLRHAGGDATFFLWLALPAGTDDEDYATRLLEAGVVVTPGSYLGTGGQGHVRAALVAPGAACERAAAIVGKTPAA